MNIIITGGCGFIGHHFVAHFLKNTDAKIFIFDKLTYAASGLERLRDLEVYDDRRVTVFTVDIANPISVGLLGECQDVEYIIHLAAETHVDRSIADPGTFVRSNVLGTMHMLNFARLLKKLKGFLYFSTDEVFGPAPLGVRFAEWDRHCPTNPYSATKAAGEELCLSYSNSYSLPVFITRTVNCFGERQHPEKFIPLCIRKILAGETVSIHLDPQTGKPGSRFYIHARNVADACLFLLSRFEQGEKYNITSNDEVSNLELARKVAMVLGKELMYEKVDFHSNRPGHDPRYALDGSKMASLGWRAPKGFDEALRKTVEWTVKNDRWLYMWGAE